MFKNKYEIFWKGRLFFISWGLLYKFRRTLTKLRFSDHNLMIEKGRKQSTKLPVDNRTRKLCFCENFQATEEEVHFLFNYYSWRKHENHRQKLTNDISNLVTHFQNLNSKEKFVSTLSSGNREISQRFPKFITTMNKDKALSL